MHIGAAQPAPASIDDPTGDSCLFCHRDDKDSDRKEFSELCHFWPLPAPPVRLDPSPLLGRRKQRQRDLVTADLIGVTPR